MIPRHPRRQEGGKRIILHEEEENVDEITLWSMVVLSVPFGP
jgi:hypothetical protein